MSGVVIRSIVEGDGEVQALPVLLRRIAYELQVWDIDIPTPHRIKRTKVVQSGELENVVDVQARRVTVAQPRAGGVLVLLDADDDCPADLGPRLLDRAVAASLGVPVGVVVANREFEAWLLAGVVSLGGQRGLTDDIAPPTDPEHIRGAKEWLEQRMSGSYKAISDQARFTARFDMKAARQGSPSFDKLWREVERLIGTSPDPEEDP
jgi:hypothetical protein